MGIMKEISIMVEETMDHIYDNFKFDSAYSGLKICFVSKLIERLEMERKELVDNFCKEDKRK